MGQIGAFPGASDFFNGLLGRVSRFVKGPKQHRKGTGRTTGEFLTAPGHDQGPQEIGRNEKGLVSLPFMVLRQP